MWRGVVLRRGSGGAGFRPQRRPNLAEEKDTTRPAEAVAPRATRARRRGERVSVVCSLLVRSVRAKQGLVSCWAAETR